MHEKFIFYVDPQSGSQRLCIPKSMLADIFKTAHNNSFHMGYHRTFHAITEGLYIWRLAHHLRQYIACCPQCQLNCTTQYAPHGSMAAIKSTSLLFYTIAIDFIVALPPSRKLQYNSILIVTDKFSKGELLIPGRNDTSAKQ